MGKTLPAALARRAKAAATAKAARDRARAEDLIALVARRRQRIGEDFYDIGVALRELREPALYKALGCATFDDLLAKKVKISPALAHELVRIVEQVPRRLALDIGQAKAAALVALAAATPEADTAASLARKKLAIRGRHAPVDLWGASGKEIRRVARAVRREHAKEGSAGHDAAGAAKELSGRLARAGVKHAEVRAVRARRKGEGESWDIVVRVPVGALGVLKRAIR